MKSSVPPKEYLDGCTFFPNSFGKITHKHVCNKHDTDYWTKRTYLSKLIADFEWFFGILNTHRRNSWYWVPIVCILATIGLLGLLTFGNIPWVLRHRWDNKNG